MRYRVASKYWLQPHNYFISYLSTTRQWWCSVVSICNWLHDTMWHGYQESREKVIIHQVPGDSSIFLTSTSFYKGKLPYDNITLVVIHHTSFWNLTENMELHRKRQDIYSWVSWIVVLWVRANHANKEFPVLATFPLIFASVSTYWVLNSSVLESANVIPNSSYRDFKEFLGEYDRMKS